jgi:hypothetical protein
MVWHMRMHGAVYVQGPRRCYCYRRRGGLANPKPVEQPVLWHVQVTHVHPASQPHPLGAVQRPVQSSCLGAMTLCMIDGSAVRCS